MNRQPRRIGRGLASIAAIAALFVGVPFALVAATRSRFASSNPLDSIEPPWQWNLSRIGDTLSGPLRDDAVVDLVIRTSLVVIWIALAIIAVTIVTEVVHMVRHRGLPAPSVRGLGWSQHLARWIAVGLIALVPLNAFAGTATALGGSPGPAATALRLVVDQDSPDPGFTVSIDRGIAAFGSEAGSDTPVSAPSAPIGAATHTVARGESIYGIAADLTGGDDARIIDIADAILDLNLGTTMHDGQRFTNPALIQPGWTLALPPGLGLATPAPADPAVAAGSAAGHDDPTPVHGTPRIEVDATTGADADADASWVDDVPDDHVAYVVVPGDTLSGIAADHLGDQDDWTLIWDENRGDDMGGGRTFDDPNLILPGWELDVATTASADPAPAPEPAPELVPPAPPVEDAQPLPAASTAPLPDMTASDGTSTDAAAATEGTASTPPVTPTTISTIETPTTSSTVPTAPGAGEVAGPSDPGPSAPSSPSPIRLEHAALLAAGVLTLVGVRRRRALRSAPPHARVPAPPPEVAAIERRLRTIDPGERSARLDVAVRAAAQHLVETGVRIGSVTIGRDGELTLRLTGPSLLEPPWVGEGATWTLPASVPIELLSDDARRVGQPCLALVTVGVDADGADVLVDLEAAHLTTVEAAPEQADDVVRAISSGLATSLDSEVVHLLVASLGPACLFDHPNTRAMESVAAAMDAATMLVGSTLANERSSFDLRTRRTGGEMWEPAIVLCASADDALNALPVDLPTPGHGVAMVVATAPASAAASVHRPGARIVGTSDGWMLDAFGVEVALTPIGVTVGDVDEIGAILDDASRPIEPATEVAVESVSSPWSLSASDGDEATADAADPFVARPHDIVVGLMGGVRIVAADGTVGEFERSKTVELIAWLATHRDRATRATARTALWEMDVRDATFANVVSEARRALARLVEPADGDEWLARTHNESLPLHERVVTDADLIGQRVEHARLAPPAHAIEVLRPAVESIRDLPFAGTSYLWPDADGITSNLVLLATTASAELAGHALSIGDTDLVFWSTGQGLKVLPGHEELIGLRMRAHARSGDLAGVRQEWESYERVIMADSWSDGEPAPKLLELRRTLLTST